MVRAVGLEPTRPYGLQILSLVCLPFHHARIWRCSSIFSFGPLSGLKTVSSSQRLVPYVHYGTDSRTLNLSCHQSITPVAQWYSLPLNWEPKELNGRTVLSESFCSIKSCLGHLDFFACRGQSSSCIYQAALWQPRIQCQGFDQSISYLLNTPQAHQRERPAAQRCNVFW